MRQRIFVLLLAVLFVFCQVTPVFAKSSGRSSSSSSKSSSSSRSSGYSGSKSSSTKSTSGYSGSKSSGTKSTSGYSGSSKSSTGSTSSSGTTARSVPNDSTTKSSSGYTGSSTSTKNSNTSSGYTGKSSSTTSTKTNSAKTSYMQDAFKKETSKSNYKASTANLNADQKKVYNDGMNSSYSLNKKMNFENSMRTRPQRITVYNNRPVIINVNRGYYGGALSYGSAYVGIWDMWFLMRASELFWYHHWNEIYTYRDHFEASQFAQMEARIRNLEAQNIARDSNYLDPDVDPDLQFSREYQEKHVDNMYYTNKHSYSWFKFLMFLLIIVAIMVILIVIIRKVTRSKRGSIPPSSGSDGGFNSRIY